MNIPGQHWEHLTLYLIWSRVHMDKLVAELILALSGPVCLFKRLALLAVGELQQANSPAGKHLCAFGKDRYEDHSAWNSGMQQGKHLPVNVTNEATGARPGGEIRAHGDTSRDKGSELDKCWVDGKQRAISLSNSKRTWITPFVAYKNREKKRTNEAHVVI